MRWCSTMVTPAKPGLRRRLRGPLAASLLVAWVGAAPHPASAAPAPRHATELMVAPQGDAGGASVRVEFTLTPTYTARLERAGRRLIVDVPASSVKGAPSAVTRKTGVVGGVMLQSFGEGAKAVTRLIVTLAEDASYAVRAEGNALLVTLTPKVAASGQGGAAAAPAAGSEQGTSAVTGVRFDGAGAEQRIVLDVTGAARPRITRRGSSSTTGAIVTSSLSIPGARLPQQLERTLDVSAFGGGVQRVSSYATADAVLVEVEHSADVTGQLQLQGSSWVWGFGKPSASSSGVARDGGVARKTRTVNVEQQPVGVPLVEDGYGAGVPVEQTLEAEQAGAFSAPLAGQVRRAFTGRRIDLDLKDADIHNVLRLLADVGRVNIVTADNVSGAVTIRMRNVPWDQALDVVLQAKGLGMVRAGNMIRVAPLAELEKEREMAIARRKQELQLAPLETRLIPVSYAEAAAIQARAKDMLSERGSIAVDERTNVLIVRDVAGNLDQIEELTRSLDTQTPQVLVEARIVEATSRYLRDVGIQWGGDSSFSAATGNPTGLAFPNRVGIVGGGSDSNTPTAGLSPFQTQVQNPNFAVNLPAAVGTGQGGALGLSFGSIDNNINLAVRLSAAESSGMLRILSSPRILTLDNREARISQGTLIPFSQVSAQGVQTTFQEAKLQLLVRPHVTADGSVAMHVKINRDEPDFNQTSARGDPTILKREAETDLLVMDGHTAVIGGIYTRNSGRNLDQVPFFGDIPLIGLLFQRRRASDVRGELVIFLTPRIVNRAEALGR